MGSSSYLFSTTATDELAMREAGASTTMELAHFSCNSPIPKKAFLFRFVFVFSFVTFNVYPSVV